MVALSQSSLQDLFNVYYFGFLGTFSSTLETVHTEIRNEAGNQWLNLGSVGYRPRSYPQNIPGTRDSHDSTLFLRQSLSGT